MIKIVNKSKSDIRLATFHVIPAESSVSVPDIVTTCPDNVARLAGLSLSGAISMTKEATPSKKGVVKAKKSDKPEERVSEYLANVPTHETNN